ncbi:peptidoglycan -binding protein [Pseudoxanthobacter sp.]|uniref:peptidoglycan -binding protein n=1 Tax=Pseudoxanthobacter sp. TaxID=1925742 RepID=UPI002FE3B245
MSLGRRRTTPHLDQWPGFVDALSTLLMVFVFLLSVFMLAQFLLSREVTSKDTALTRLNAQIAELTQLLAMERAGKADAQDSLAQLQASLDAALADRDRLQGLLTAAQGSSAGAGSQVSELQGALVREQKVSRDALAQVELLNQQISALRRQIAALETALDASEQRDRESQAQIADLGRRLNLALAQKVQELSRYRSDFFGRLREILADRPDIRVVGDRFVFQSEVLFASGSDEVNAEGKVDLDKLADAILQLEKEIPKEIPWVLRVDGHTDSRPLSGVGRFRSNWQLSSARAIAVVTYLIGRGVDPQHLAAAAFGEFQPLDTADTDEARARNRRIELKLTER